MEVVIETVYLHGDIVTYIKFVKVTIYSRGAKVTDMEVDIIQCRYTKY